MPANGSVAGSPMGATDILQSDDESWAFLNTPNTNSHSDSSVAFMPSPASQSLASYGVVVLSDRGQQTHRGLSPSLSSIGLRSPVQLQMAPTSSPAIPATVPSPSIFPTQAQQPSQTSYPMQLSDGSSPDTAGLLSNSQFMTPDAGGLLSSPDDFLLDQFHNLVSTFSAATTAPALISNFTMLQQQAEQQAQQQAQLQAQMQQQAINLDIPSQMQSPVDVQPWNPLTMSDPQDAQMFSMDGFPLSSPSPPAPFTPGSFGSSQEASPPSMGGGRLELSSGNISQLPETSQRASPFNQFQIQDFFMEQQPLQPQPQPHSSTAPPAASSKSPSTAATVASRPIPARSSGSSINKVRGAGSRIEKRKATNTSSSAEKIQASVSSSAASEDKFFIVTPTTINSHTGHGSRIFECLEAMSATQKGRKGPLAEEIKEGALQVRRLGACFCCHARKVRCDAQRPCKNCMKLRLAVPFAVCWRFDDFLADLFPSKIRVHLSKDKMMAFYQENIFSFDVANVPAEPITIHLSSGMAFKNTLEIRGVRFFNPATIDIVRHERLLVEGNNAFRKVFLAVPLALEMSDTSLISASQQQEKVRKALRSYVENIIAEEPYVNQIGASINHTDLPKKILHMVWNYYMETESLIVKQALVIYTMHYMMAQHLSIAKESILKFKSTKLMPQEDDFLTSRMLGRQVKTILDELLQEEVDKLFKMFSRELKPKSRASWAPCLAAFLVLCLFMEAVGLVIDRFVNAHNEKELQSDRSPKNSGYLRSEAVNLSRAIENMPFRQFAFQFHNVYQTHQTPPGAVNVTTSSSSAGSPSSSMSSAASVAASAAKISFNPLLDDTLLLSNDLDKPAVELVTRLRELLTGDSLIRLQELSWTPILDAIDPYPYPRDVAVDYNGRLCSKFLLSFYDKDKIFTQPSSF